jgi:hypothetical protein
VCGITVFTIVWALLQEAILLGVLSLIMAWVVQAFFASVLLNVVDATFFCYAIDKDQHAVTNLEVHDIFTQVCATASPLVWRSYSASPANCS